MTNEPPTIRGLEPKREPHEVHVKVECNEEDVQPLELTGRGVLVVVFGEDGDARRVVPHVHALSPVDLWGAMELVKHMGDDLWEYELDQAAEEAEDDDDDDAQTA